MSDQAERNLFDDYLQIDRHLPALKNHALNFVRSTGKVVRGTGAYTVGVAKIYQSLLPLLEMINRDSKITPSELHAELDEVFANSTN